MITTNLHQADLTEFTGQVDLDQQCRATFPMFGAHGTSDCATVYFEVDAGKRLGRHTDSAEEILYIVDGDAEVTVGDETGKAGSGDLLLVPKMVPHDVRNVGSKPLKVLGFFGGAKNIVATFDGKWNPVDSDVVDTSTLY